MTDSRFTSLCEDATELVEGLDVDELAVCAAESAIEAGPHEGRADSVQAGSDVLAMSEDELVTALQHALGMVPVFNTLEDE